jgi:predicted RNA binding protein YcfA (HicA-like mRNA interferase family)
VLALLERGGFVQVRQRGSHVQLRHPDGHGTAAPLHAGRGIAPPLLRRIAHDIGLTVEELVAGESREHLRASRPTWRCS